MLELTPASRFLFQNQESERLNLVRKTIATLAALI